VEGDAFSHQTKRVRPILMVMVMIVEHMVAELTGTMLPCKPSA
jgi:hypothetical protein